MEENLHSWVFWSFYTVTMFNIFTRVNHLVSTTIAYYSRSIHVSDGVELHVKLGCHTAM